MLKHKVTTTGGRLPPVDTTPGAVVGYVAAGTAANEPAYKREEAHARRMRRQRRNERGRTRAGQGWAVSLW